MDMKIGRWSNPILRPSIMATIRSEALWLHGADACVARLLHLVESVGGHVLKNQLSRADICTDIILPDSLWGMSLLDHIVTRAAIEDPHLKHRTLTGFSIGRGKVSARIYDKPREIAEKSKKFWMYKVWGLESVPEGCRVIRIEYQLRREGLAAFGLDVYPDLETVMPNLWASLTQDWLRLVEDASKHAARQYVMPWWRVVQQAVPGAQAACPLIRAQAIGDDIDQLGRQALGHITSMVALLRQGELIAPDELLDLDSHIPLIADLIRRAGWDDEKFTDEVKKKQAKRMRHAEKFAAASGARGLLGLSLKRPAERRPPGAA